MTVTNSDRCGEHERRIFRVLYGSAGLVGYEMSAKIVGSKGKLTGTSTPVSGLTVAEQRRMPSVTATGLAKTTSATRAFHFWQCGAPKRDPDVGALL